MKYTKDSLQNTWGIVESKEHAEFIIELCNANGINIYGKVGAINHFTISNECLSFYNCDGISSTILKQITIPLPPKEPLKNAGDNLILDCEDSKCDEWPQVGDEVLICNKTNLEDLFRFKGKLCTVIGVSHHEGVKVITVANSSQGIGAFNMGEWIQKPKTPEDELRELLHLLWGENGGDFDDFIEIAIEHVTKKPQ